MLQNLLEPTPLPPSVRANRLAIGSPEYNEILDFLYDEAEMPVTEVDGDGCQVE